MVRFILTEGSKNNYVYIMNIADIESIGAIKFYSYDITNGEHHFYNRLGLLVFICKSYYVIKGDVGDVIDSYHKSG